MIRAILIIIFIFLNCASYAQVSKSTITTEVANSTAMGKNGQTILNNMVNSYVDWITCTGTGGMVYWSIGVPTCLSAGANGTYLTVSGGIPNWTSVPPSSPGINKNTGRSVTTTPTVSSSDCGNPIFLGGNALYTVTVGATSGFSANCVLMFVNTDSYTGVGTGRGKVMTITTLPQHVLYPGQTLSIRMDPSGSFWTSDQQLFGVLGQPWYVNGPSFFADTGGSDTANDGLASGASNAFRTLSYMFKVGGQASFSRNSQTVTFLNATAGQSFTDSVTLIGTNSDAPYVMQLQSTVPGTPFTWNCASSYCLYWGDMVGVQIKDITINAYGNVSPLQDHQFGIIDIESGVTIVGANGTLVGINCDDHGRFNIFGLTFTGTFSQLFGACQHSSWNINNTLNGSGASMTRLYSQVTDSTVTFQGNVSFTGSPTVTNAPALYTNSVTCNLSGATIPGGTPSPTSPALYSTSSNC